MCVGSEVERWCSECEVLFTSPEFLFKHQERCGQGGRRRSKKRTLQHSDLFPRKYLKTKREPHIKDGEKTTVRNYEDCLVEDEDVDGPINDCSDVSDAAVDHDSSSDLIVDPSFISNQPPDAGNTATHSDDNVCLRLCHTPQVNTGSGNYTFSSDLVLGGVKDQDKPHSERNYNVSKSTVEKVVCHSRKGSCDSICVDKSLLVDTELSMYLGHTSKELYQSASSSHGILKGTNNSNEIQNLSPVIPQNSHETSNQFTEFGSKTINISLDSSGVVLDSFLNHDVTFLDPLNLEESTLSNSIELAADCHKSHINETVLQDKSTDHSSGYSSFNCTNSANESSNVSDSSLSLSGLTLSCSKPARKPQVPSRENTLVEKLCHEEQERKKSRHICNISTTKDCQGTRNSCQSIQSSVKGRRCSPSDGMRMMKKQNTDDTNPKLSVSRAGKCSDLDPDAMLHTTLKKNNLTNASFQLYWKKRQDIDCKWKMSNHSTIKQLKIYVTKKHTHGREMGSRTNSAIQPQEGEGVLAQVKHCTINNTTTHLNRRESVTGIHCNNYYAEKMSHRMSHENRVKMIGNCSRQSEQCVTLEHGRQDTLSPSPYHEDILHGIVVNNYNPSPIIGSRRSNVYGKEDSCARTQPFQSVRKKYEQNYSTLCPKKDVGTLYECYKCRRKFTTLYNLRAHQYLCV